MKDKLYKKTLLIGCIILCIILGALGCKESANLDTTAPIPGNSGTIAASNAAANSVTLSWTKAADDICPQSVLQYSVVYSEGPINKVGTIDEIISFGTVLVWCNNDYDIDSYTVSGLFPETTYFFNIVVTDPFLNETAYTSLQVETTLDTTAPTPGDSGTISASNIQPNSVDLSWTKAADDISAESALGYRVYYSTSDNLDSVEDIETNGTASGNYTADIATKVISGLSPETPYYFNIIVRDEAGNKAPYATVSAETEEDTTPPVPGNSGTITVSNTGIEDVTLNWTKATDDTCEQSELIYTIVYSEGANYVETANDIHNNIFTHLVEIGYEDIDIDSCTVNGLMAGTYFFNILLRDGYGNETVYTSISATVL